MIPKGTVFCVCLSKDSLWHVLNIVVVVVVIAERYRCYLLLFKQFSVVS